MVTSFTTSPTCILMTLPPRRDPRRRVTPNAPGTSRSREATLVNSPSPVSVTSGSIFVNARPEASVTRNSTASRTDWSGRPSRLTSSTVMNFAVPEGTAYQYGTWISRPEDVSDTRIEPSYGPGCKEEALKLTTTGAEAQGSS